MSKKTIQVGINIRAKMPTLPNFIRVQVGDGEQEQTLPVMAFSESELRRIGEQWTEALVEHRQKQIKLKQAVNRG